MIVIGVGEGNNDGQGLRVRLNTKRKRHFQNVPKGSGGFGLKWSPLTSNLRSFCRALAVLASYTPAFSSFFGSRRDTAL
jgi:hypothetical protein